MDRTPWEPTTALPSTEQKIQVLHARAMLRQPLFHPLDATDDDMARASRVFEIAKPARLRLARSNQVGNHFAMVETAELTAQLAALARAVAEIPEPPPHLRGRPRRPHGPGREEQAMPTRSQLPPSPSPRSPSASPLSEVQSETPPALGDNGTVAHRPVRPVPFTPEHLALLRGRVRRREPLHQPGDRPLCDRSGLVLSRRRGLRRIEQLQILNGHDDRTLVSLDEVLPLLPCRRRTLVNLVPHMPSPRECEDWPSGRGLACRWWWCELRPWLQRRFRIELPAAFPS